MAKKANNAKKLTYFKLGEKSNYFFDPTTRLEVMPNTIVPVSASSAASAKFKKAKNHGHIVAVTKDDYDEYLAKKDKQSKSATSKKEASKPKAKDYSDSERFSRDEMNKMKRDELDAYAKAQLGMTGDLDEDDIESTVEEAANKAELIEILIQHWEDNSEEDDEDEEDEDEEDED